MSVGFLKPSFSRLCLISSTKWYWEKRMVLFHAKLQKTMVIPVHRLPSAMFSWHVAGKGQPAIPLAKAETVIRHHDGGH
jgi:hypothetical protein